MITQERLHELFDYDPNGFLINKINRSNSFAGKAAERLMTNGYKRTFVDNKEYSTHRLIWLYFNGVMPSNDLDHINGIRADNRIENLREATRSQNMQNEKKARASSSHGFLGVTKHGKKWRAALWINGVKKNLGVHETPEQAHQAYLKAKKLFHPFQTIA